MDQWYSLVYSKLNAAAVSYPDRGDGGTARGQMQYQLQSRTSKGDIQMDKHEPILRRGGLNLYFVFASTDRRGNTEALYQTLDGQYYCRFQIDHANSFMDSNFEAVDY